MSPLLLAVALGHGISQSEVFHPEPLPAWTDAIDLSTDSKLVNLRVTSSKYKMLRPGFRVGDITSAIKEDANLVIGGERSVGQRPAGKREVGLDDYVLFLHSANGFRREIVTDLHSNVAQSYVIEVESPNEKAPQFAAWAQKMSRQFGKPNIVVRRENSEDINQPELNGRPFSEVEDLKAIGQSVLTFIWVWGIDDSETGGLTPKYNENMSAMTSGPTTTILLTYAERSTVSEKGRKRKLPRVIRLWINPQGVMAG